MSPETKKIQQKIEEALDELAESRGKELSRQIRPILFTNLDRGRVKYSTNGDADLISSYVWRVANEFSAQFEYIRQIQSKRSTEVWEPLFERMQIWAYNFFLRKNFAADPNTQEIAAECATDAALTLLNAHFPYDTDFDPWAHIIVQNACRKYIHKNLKKSAVPQESMVDLQENFIDPNEVLPEVRALQKESGVELTYLLAQLSDARRSVIEFIYLNDMSPVEVAEKMGKSVGAIYSLQFHALGDLRKILSTIRDNLNE